MHEASKLRPVNVIRRLNSVLLDPSFEREKFG